MERDTVAGYFSNGDDAHRAINELLHEGFSATEIGAAFHTGASSRSSSRSIAEVPDKAPVRSSGAADSPPAGAASGTGAVFPGGLSAGGGTVIAGASQPGPITGSEIPSDLPRDIPSELASDSGGRGASRPANSVPVSTTSARPTTSSETRTHEGWWDKLKHVFGGGERDQTTGRREPVSDKGALNYGTGEGHLPVSSGYNYAYSGSAFESSFSGMGIPQEHSRRLSRDLRRGGAVITVRAGSRNSTAEAVLQRNNGVVRYESVSATEEPTWESGNQEARVEVFGEVHRVYPGYVPGEDVRSRKAS
jgi:hypothetical protein